MALWPPSPWNVVFLLEIPQAGFPSRSTEGSLVWCLPSPDLTLPSALDRRCSDAPMGPSGGRGVPAQSVGSAGRDRVVRIPTLPQLHIAMLVDIRGSGASSQPRGAITENARGRQARADASTPEINGENQ